MASGTLAAALREAAQPLNGDHRDHDALVQLVGDARVVCLGEASHGTHEFYRERAQITKRLIADKGFTAVCIEGDWPDAYRVNRWVRADRQSRDAGADEALGGFHRFPTWMWRNADVLDFVGWLRAHNERGAGAPVSFYGIDLYSLFGSIEAVLAYLERVDPSSAAEARKRYECFDQFAGEAQAYGYATMMGDAHCEAAAKEQLAALRRRMAESADDHFSAEQNARLVQNAEHYYRTMFGGRVSSWNLRDTHMADTIDAILAHHGPGSRVVVWAHNSHLGDARATQMGRDGELNVGQLMRERHGREAVLIGFSTYEGTVTAAREWDLPADRRRVRRGLAGSYEALFHQVGIERFYLPLRELGEVGAGLREPRLQRAIGVIYAPQTERLSHYFETRLPDQFDAILHFDVTRAVEPLERTAAWRVGEPPETYPSAL